MWKFHNFSATYILREINFGHIKASKIASLPILAALNFEILELFHIFKHEIPKKSKFKASKMVKMTIFNLLKSTKFDFT